ncbi:Anp1-domain-containing protein [Syncephalis plumigaleata]|nr:Anp1-domain-containing protein [Syncephalis plumigaleata]
MALGRYHLRILLFYSASMTMLCFVAFITFMLSPDCVPLDVWSPAQLAHWMEDENAEAWLNCLMHSRNDTKIETTSNRSNRIIERNLNPSVVDVNPTNQSMLPPTLLVLTPLKNAVHLLDRYFELLDRMPMQNNYLYSKLQPIQHQYRYVTLLRRDFNYELPNEQRKAFTEQQTRRSIMARVRNHLVMGALQDEHWVLWWDVDLMMIHDRDIVTANCYWKWIDGTMQPYDLNAWHETDESRHWAKSRPPNELFLEGYDEMWTHRNQTLVPLDSVGGTLLLVKAEVHRSGVLFPSMVYKHQIETEGFGLMARDAGYNIYGLPHLKILHYSG